MKPVQVRYTPEGWESTEIDWDDYQRMGTVRRYTPRSIDETPEWALNDLKLRMVIVERERNYKPSARMHSREGRANRRNVRRAGSYRAMLAGIAYRTWRLGWDSPTVAREMGITSVLVRQHLYKMKEAAAKLAANGWKPLVPEFVEGEICWYCRKRPVNKARCKWCCDICQDWASAWNRRRARRRRILKRIQNLPANRLSRTQRLVRRKVA